jgi:tetratricopeptide (TPR) repeat protein
MALALQAQTPSTAVGRALPDDVLARVSPIIDAVYRLDYARAEALSQQLIKSSPDYPAGYVYLFRVYWSEQLSEARLLSAERLVSMDLFAEKPKFQPAVAPQVLERLDHAASAALAKAESWVKQHPDDATAQFLLGTAYQFKSGYELTVRYSLREASVSANRAFKIHHELAQTYQMADAEVTAGAYSIIADSMDWFPKLVSWILFGTRGNINEGRRALERASERGTIGAPDARMLLAIVYTRQKRFDEAKALLGELHQAYPENYLLHLDMASVDLLANRPAGAIATYREILARNYPGLEHGVALTRLGVASRVAGDLPESERWLWESIKDSAASGGWRPVAHVELGKTLDLEGQRAKAVEQYRAALQGPDFLGLHEEAERLIKNAYDRNTMLQDDAVGGLVTLK